MVLLEREPDLARVDVLLDDSAAQASGRLITVTGPPGVGLTRFVSEVELHATARGFRVVTATGGELERDLSLGVVRQLLAADDPAVQPGTLISDILSGSDGIATRTAREGVLWAALQAWCTSLARTQPVLLSVDDLHWADGPSARFLLYLLRRFARLPVVLVLALRPSAPMTRPVELDLVANRTDLALRLSPLTPAAVDELVFAWFGERSTPAFTQACAGATGGNPMLLRQLLGEASTGLLHPRDEDVAEVGALGSADLARRTLARVERLAPSAVAVAESVALLGNHATLPLTAAVAEVPDEQVELTVDALVRADVLSDEQPLRFVHPIVRTAICRAMSGGLRSHRHRAAAHLLDRAGASEDDVAAHLLQATPARDAWVTGYLAGAGRRALEAGRPDLAVRLLRRAAEEDPVVVEPELLLHLGEVETQVRDPAALSHLERAFDVAVTSLQVGRAALALARSLAFRHCYSEAMQVLDTALLRLDPTDRETRLWLRSERLWLMECGDATPNGYVEEAERLAAGLTGETAGERLALAHLGAARLFSCVPREQVRKLARRALGNGALLDEAGPESPGWLYSAGLLWVVGDYGKAETELLRGEQRALDKGALPALQQVRATRAWVRYELGDLPGAEELARAVPTVHGSSMGARYARACLLTVLTEQGRLDEAAALDAPAPGGRPLDRCDALLLHAQAELRLARGDEGGVEDLLTVGRWCDERGIHNPGEWAWRTDVAPALAARGDVGLAQQLIEEEVRRARRFGAPRPLGRALHAAALLAPPVSRLTLMHEAIEVLGAGPARLATARGQLQLGIWLRSAGEPGGAQNAFRLALEAGDACGAVPVATHARRLLQSVGARPRRAALSGPEALTSMEREVAALAVAGRTNREIAEQLFVSVKAVEKHLHNTYAKLGIDRRPALAAALDVAAPLVESPQNTKR